MGSRIAAHFANAGIPALLLDLKNKQPGDPNLVARQGIETAAKQKPTAFFVPSNAGLIETGNFDDDLSKIKSCQWIIEAVTENLQIKRDIWERVDRQRAPDAILSTNTSGIPLREISHGFSTEFQRQFLGTHFFNPPRYLHLLEVIPGEKTNPDILKFVSDLRRITPRQRDRLLQRHAAFHRKSDRQSFSEPPL